MTPMRLCLALVAASNCGFAEPYAPDWASLDTRPIPGWFNEAKFGIFVVWGVYSVPAWSPKGTYAEWYGSDMNDPKKPTYDFHRKTYGADFKYSDFVPQFTAELFDPAGWADLFQRSGAKYVVLTAKYHDGFCLWPSAYHWNWNSVDVGPHRDLVGDLTAAVREKGLRMGYYYSLYEWYHPLYRSDAERFAQEHMTPQLKELVTRYQPDMLWPDGEWEQTSAVWHSPEFLAWLFNESPVKDHVVVNDRWGKECRGRHGDFYTFEYGGCTEITKETPHPWEEDRGMGASYGYNRNESIDEYASAKDLVRLLVDTATLGGNLLLDIGPTADGRIPVIMQERLVQIGEWLAVNGESIYGTTAGPFLKPAWGGCTRKPGRIYFHVFDWPADGLRIEGLTTPIRKAWLLSDPAQAPLSVTSESGVVHIALPACAPHPIASVIACEIDGDSNKGSTTK